MGYQTLGRVFRNRQVFFEIRPVWFVPDGVFGLTLNVKNPVGRGKIPDTAGGRITVFCPRTGGAACFQQNFIGGAQRYPTRRDVDG